MSRPSDGTGTTSCAVPASRALAAWRWQLSSPNAGVSASGGVSSERVRSRAVTVRHDQHGRRLGWASEQLVEFRGVEQRAVARNEQHALDAALDRGGDGERRRLAVSELLVVKDAGAVAAGDLLRVSVAADDDDLVDPLGASQGDQHVGEHRLDERAPRAGGEVLDQPLLGVRETLDGEDRLGPHQARTLSRGD